MIVSRRVKGKKPGRFVPIAELQCQKIEANIERKSKAQDQEQSKLLLPCGACGWQGRGLNAYIRGWSLIPPLMTGILIIGYINVYYWVGDHLLSYGNTGSLDPSTCDIWKTNSTFCFLVANFNGWSYLFLWPIDVIQKSCWIPTSTAR